MKNVEYLQFNAYATSNDGKKNYRAVNVNDNGKSVWRLCVEVKHGKQWDYISEKRFCSAYDAICAITD